MKHFNWAILYNLYVSSYGFASTVNDEFESYFRTNFVNSKIQEGNTYAIENALPKNENMNTCNEI